MELRRLSPDSGTLTVAEAISGLDLGARAPAERPYLIVNFISSADGKAAFQGRSGPLGNDADKAIFHRLRTQVDAVLVGSGTLRAERYGRLVRDPELRAAREGEGLAPDPVACVVTRTLNLPPEISLFQDPDQPALIFTSSQEPVDELGPGATVERLDPAELTMTTVLEQLRSRHDVDTVLCEGGPTIFGVLLSEGLVDELFLTVAPKLAGGGEPTPLEGAPLSELVELEPIWALESEGALFLRYRVVND